MVDNTSNFSWVTKTISAKWLLSDTFPLLVTSSLQHFRDTKKLRSTRLCKTALHENNFLELENFFFTFMLLLSSSLSDGKEIHQKVSK